ncbi:M1 family metallopeptidase [Pendulispora albinea]|uniref:Aminopeptidase n=1 Tax=Pendulispora albinea TaxID=2741071 RepID=A0ABZ2LZT7_9BACT
MKLLFKPIITKVAVTTLALSPIAACSGSDDSFGSGLQGAGSTNPPTSTRHPSADCPGAPGKPGGGPGDLPAIDKSAKPMELPDTVWPKNYKLWFRPDAALKTFIGRADVEIEVRKPVDAITVAAHGITFARDRSTLRNRSNPSKAIPLIPTPQTLGDLVQLRLNSGQIAPGTYQLHMEWDGKIQFSDAEYCPPEEVVRNPFCSAATGIFKVGLSTPEGVSSDAIVTQGETNYARQWFPGWDEPAFRLTFEVTAEVPGEWKAVSNGASLPPIKLPDGYQQVSFEKTPAMPSYLLFFGGGKFDVLEEDLTSPLDGSLVRLRWFTPPGRSSWASFAMQWTKEVTAYYYKYTNAPLPFKKLDTIAANDSYNNKPRTSFSGMENWAAIFENADRVLTKPGDTPTRGTVSLITHELAHQWFGDLVTPDWWDNVWLNESFATWFANRTMIQFHPEYYTFTDYVNGKVPVFDADVLATALPVQRNLSDAGSFGFFRPSVFVYTKGNYVLQTLENYLGAEGMRKGLQIYLKDYGFGNGTPERLWRSLEQGSGKKVAAIGDSFIRQTGMPLVTLDTECVGRTTHVSIAQQAFPNQNAYPASRWNVPLTIAYGDTLKERKTIVLTEGGTRIELPGCTAVVANPTGLDYYVSNYSGPAWSHLLAKVQSVASNKPLLTNIVNDATRLLAARLISQAQFDQIKNVINLPAPLQADTLNALEDAHNPPHPLHYRGEMKLRENPQP